MQRGSAGYYKKRRLVEARSASGSSGYSSRTALLQPLLPQAHRHVFVRAALLAILVQAAAGKAGVWCQLGSMEGQSGGRALQQGFAQGACSAEHPNFVEQARSKAER